MEKIIEVRGLVKSYGEIEAVRGIDFYVERGRFRLWGAQRAGNSATVDILSTDSKMPGSMFNGLPGERG